MPIFARLNGLQISCLDAAGQFNYTVAFFTTSYQIDVAYDISYSTGDYTSISALPDGTYDVLFYTAGSDCLGIARTMTVHVACAITESITCPDSTSCYYTMGWSTPLACPGSSRHLPVAG